MPTYVYKCRDCDHAFERFEKMTATTRTRKCPACGGRAVRQISGGAGFLFKGEGFYITDYRSQEYRSKASADKPAEPAAPGAGEKAPAATGSESSGAASSGAGAGKYAKDAKDSAAASPAKLPARPAKGGGKRPPRR